MTWSLEQAYEVYPQIEEEFSASLDLGCGEGRQAVALHRRFGFRITGIDPVH